MPVDIFDYVYALLHDPLYCEKYGNFLCRDFPRVPLVNTPQKDRNFYVSEELFWQYVSIGGRLRKLHLMQEKVPMELTIEPNTSDYMEIATINYENSILHINNNKSIIGIPKDVWDYQIGGHQVIEKWFKEHKGEVLTLELFTHVEDVVGLISETIAIEKELYNLH